MNSQDTIVAIATPPGRGGLGLVRLSGPAARAIALQIFPGLRPRPWRLQHAKWRENGELVDEVLVAWFPAPRSYTAEDVIEISAHGSPVLLRHLVQACLQQGARLAEAGEFTQRAFLNGRLDLTQAEAIGDLIHAQTLAQARHAARQMEGSLARALKPLKHDLCEFIARLEAGIDFADDDVSQLGREEIAGAAERMQSVLAAMAASYAQGRWLREGALLALAGRPNAGKSSLFNRLLAMERALVAAEAGTTRDVITERLQLAGIPVTLADTAGLRDAAHAIERQGMEKTREALAEADLVLLVLDGAAALTDADFSLMSQIAQMPRVVVARNKCDLPCAWSAQEQSRAMQAIHFPCPSGQPPWLEVSALTGEGLDALRAYLAHTLVPQSEESGEWITNQRQARHLEAAAAALARMVAANRQSAPHEALLVCLYAALQELDALTGQTTAEDILGLIFSSFCIGK